MHWKSAKLQNLQRVVLASATLWFSLVAFAASHEQYDTSLFPHLRNRHIQDQLAEETNRIFEQTPLYSLALDGYLFRNYNYEYYHGGYWLDGFLELRPTENLSLNLKLSAYNPAASYGYAATSFLHSFINLGWYEEFPWFGGTTVEGTFFDLDRQTLGAGLTFSEKEMSGVDVNFRFGMVNVRYLFHGTGGYNYQDDVSMLQFDLWREKIGIARIDMIAEEPFFTLFSIYDINNAITVGAESGQRYQAKGHTAYIRGHFKFNNLTFVTKYQFRRYEDKFADGIVGDIDHDYTSIMQKDKAYADSINIFVVDDHVDTHSGIVNGLFEIPLALAERSFQIRVFSENDFGELRYQDKPLDKYYFFKHGLGLCPQIVRDDCAYVFFSNKALSAYTSAHRNDIGNKPLFVDEGRFWGFEARLKL